MLYPQLQDYLEHSAHRLPDKVALVHEDERVTFQELDRRANALAHTLVERRVSRGDRVIVFGDNSVKTVIAFWGVLKANAAVSIVSPLTKADKLAYYLNDCRAAALITDEHLEGVWQEPASRSTWLKTTLVAPKDRALTRGARRAATPSEHRHRPRFDHLHFRLHGRPEGRHADAPQHAHGRDVHLHYMRMSKTM